MEVVNPTALQTPKATQPKKVKKSRSEPSQSSKLEESEPPAESEFMDAKLQRIIAKLKRKADALDEDSAPFFPAAQHKPKKAKQDKAKNEAAPKGKTKKAPKDPSQVELESESIKAYPKLKSYKAGRCGEARVEFIRRKKAKDYSHMEACRMWMRSNQRADLISTLSEAELKRRRFL